MNPRAVIWWSAAALTIVVTTNNPVYRGLALLAALNLLLARRRPGVQLRPLAVAMAISVALATALSALFSHGGSHVLATLPETLPAIGGPLTLEGLAYGAGMGLGLAAAVAAAAPLTLIASGTDLVEALPHRLERTGAALGTSVSMIPGITRSFAAVREAQRVRGVRLTGLQGMRYVLVPVTLTALEQSLDRAEALDARAFGSGPRTRAFASPWSPVDVAVAVAAVVAAAAFVGLRVAGLAPGWVVYPNLTAPPAGLAVLPCALLLLPALLPGPGASGPAERPDSE